MECIPRKPTASSPNRLGPLSKLPLFFDLTGKRAVVAGGTEAAAWKAELLAAAGADVEIYAAEIGSDMGALIKRGAAAGSLTPYEREWSADVLENAAIAIADVDTDDAAGRFHAAAIAAGTIVNVIDKPSFCQFQFGSIVNRSPVVVGISTDGAAPILGQAVRRRIETLLPPALADWGRLAQELRSRVRRTLSSATQRRAFWEQLAERAFGPPPSTHDRETMLDQIDKVSATVSSARGSVTLVGAGPGDAEMLTLKAVRALQSADIILFDDLVSDEVLELSRREAKRMLVGKRGGRASCAQGDINALMIKLAKQGKHVVRLKSGDPMVFGRAGEELTDLRAHGIPVAVVPGITAASAMASALATSLTHRDHAHSVRFVTGHSRQGVLPEDLDWIGIADRQTTLVFYMGARTGPMIANRLMACGLPGSTPVVMMSAVTRATESRWCGTLQSLGHGDAVFDPTAPVIIGVGDVFAGAISTAALSDDHCAPHASSREAAL